MKGILKMKLKWMVDRKAKKKKMKKRASIVAGKRKRPLQRGDSSSSKVIESPSYSSTTPSFYIFTTDLFGMARSEVFSLTNHSDVDFVHEPITNRKHCQMKFQCVSPTWYLSSLFPFTHARQDLLACFSSILVLGKLYCLGGAFPLGHIKIHPTTGALLVHDDTLKIHPTTSVYPVDPLSDSFIYSASNRERMFQPVPTVISWDLGLDPDEQWDYLEPMRVGRCQPSVATHNDQIYVFGCSITQLKNLHPFAEVFDPREGRWKTLINELPLLSYLSMDTIVAATNCALVENQTKLLIIFTQNYICWTFSFENPYQEDLCPIPLETITCCSQPLLQYSSCPAEYAFNRIVVVDDLAFIFVNTLYVRRLKDGVFHEFSEQEATPLQVLDTESTLPNTPNFLFHIGDMRFGLIWKPQDIECLFFRVVKDGENLEDLSVVVEGRTSYYDSGDHHLIWASM